MRDAPSPLIDPADAKLAVNGLVSFAANLYGRLSTGSGNLLVSPYSVGTALAMLAAGARGKTFDELQDALLLPPVEKFGPAFRGLAESIAAVPKWTRSRPELAIANAIWAQQNHPWNAQYITHVRDTFQSALFDVDFRGSARTVTERINRWTEENTRGRIRNLIAPGALDSETRIVLTNAIYFKARWANVFEPRGTKPEDFITPTGAKVKAPLMYHHDKFGLMETKSFQSLRLPYDGYTTSMYVFLPRSLDGLPELERKLSGANLAHWTSFCEPCEVKVWLPKFKFAVPANLRQPLAALGVNEAFDRDKANFRGMTDHPEELFLSGVIHEACIEVDEIGTEAAAATAGWVAGGGGRFEPPPPPKAFRADHPFLFAIKHEETGAVLFIGRVEDPTK